MTDIKHFTELVAADRTGLVQKAGCLGRAKLNFRGDFHR
jgi:hypothetical protein